MLRRVLPSVLLLLATGSLGIGQGLSGPQRCKLRIVVTNDQQAPIKDLTVELMDAVGLSSAMSTKITDSDGQTNFDAWTGHHRVRVYGSEIQEYNGEFDIEPRESFHLERIRVWLKSGAVPLPQPGEESVSTSRLKIPDNARKEFQKGAHALQRKDWQVAKKRFETAIARYPDYDLAYNGLGVACSQLNDTPAARQSFEKAIRLNENFAGANRNLARILLAEQKNSEALPLLKHSLSTEPENAWALTHAAYVEFMLHDFGNALLDARKAHTVPHDGFANVHIVAAMALEATDKPTEAVEEYRLYLQEDANGRDAERARNAIARLSGKAPN